jgi:hypothetical protein
VARPDRVTVGLTQVGLGHLSEVLETGWFEEEMDAYRVAIAVALARGLCADAGGMVGVKTKFNVGSLDNDGKLRTLITTLAPSSGDRPYEHAERLAEAGVAYLAEKLGRQGATLTDVLAGKTVEGRP